MVPQALQINKAVATLVRDSSSWSLISVLISGYGIALFVTLLMGLVSFETAAVNIVSWLHQTFSNSPLLQQYFASIKPLLMDSQNNIVIDLSNMQSIGQLMLILYLKLLLPFVILGLLVDFFRRKKHQTQPTLKQKIQRLMLACGVLSGLWIFYYLFAQDPTIQFAGVILIIAVIVPLLVFAICAIPLWLAHHIGQKEHPGR